MMDLQTLRTLKRNRKELLNAEQAILYAMVLDYQHNIVTEPVVSEKIFEISFLIQQVDLKIKQCKEILKKNKK